MNIVGETDKHLQYDANSIARHDKRPKFHPVDAVSQVTKHAGYRWELGDPPERGGNLRTSHARTPDEREAPLRIPLRSMICIAYQIMYNQVWNPPISMIIANTRNRGDIPSEQAMQPAQGQLIRKSAAKRRTD